MSKRMNRRTLLRGVASGLPVVVALPTLDAMLNMNGTALAQNEGLPVRMGVWYWGSGVHPGRFFPSEAGTGWSMTQQLRPLEEVRDEFSILSGHNIKSKGVVHHVGSAVMKTGKNHINLSGRRFDTDVDGPSFDVVAAEELAAPVPFSQLNVGVYSDGEFKGEGLNTRALSHNGTNQTNYAETSLQAVFDRLFADDVAVPDTGAASLAIHLAGRKSVLDAVRTETDALLPKVGAADKIRLEQHLESIRAIEGRLESDMMEAPALSSCTKPGSPGVGEPDRGSPDLITHNEVMVDLLVTALSCDLTRVFTFRHHGWTDDPNFDIIGVNMKHHPTTHNESGDQPNIQKITEFTMSQLNKFLVKMRDTPDGAGSLLSNSGIMCYSEVAEGRSHSTSNIPILMAGQAGGKLLSGIHHKGGGDSVTKAHLTLARAVGLPWQSYGDNENRVEDSIGAIEA